MNQDAAAAYLAAFIDGEGHVGCHMTRRGKVTKTLAFTNTDKQLFDNVISIAASIGFEFNIYMRKSERVKWSDKWIAYLRGGVVAFERFRDLVPIQCEKKRIRLDEVIASYRTPQQMEQLHASRRTKKTVNCLRCGKEFYAFPADLKRGQGKYCSRRCSRIKQIEMTCQSCGETYTVGPSRYLTSNFCSQKCSGKSQTERVRGMASMAAQTRWRRVASEKSSPPSTSS